MPSASRNPSELADLSLADASEQVRTRRVSPVELTRACLARIDALNPSLNAWITVTAESALVEARAAEAAIGRGEWRGPLHGIPIGLKDLFDTAGVKTTAACAQFADRIPEADAEVVRRLREAGAVILGKQNLHEIAFGTTSAISHYGPVRNPRNRELITGGSSGGSAAAVATGMGFGAIGSDTGGSIRIPAALCGVVGLKPTYGRVSVRGALPLAPSLDHAGPITRTVRDAAMLLEAIAEPGQPAPASRAAAAASLRIGVPRDYFFDGLDAEVAQVVEMALGTVARLTAGLRNVTLPVFNAINAAVLPVEAWAVHRDRIASHPERFHPAVLGRLQGGAAVLMEDYLERRKELKALRETPAAVFKEVDLLVTPTVAIPPGPIEGSGGDEASAGLLSRLTRPFNSYGWPAISIPCGMTAEGLPVGLQIVGPPWAEGIVLALGHAFEAAISPSP